MAGRLKIAKAEWIPLAIVLLAVLVLLCLNATSSALWFDESIEYFYSKVISGPVPGARTTTGMYERIAITYQPPLYNWLMYLWLSVFDSEFGFRLAGILTTVVGGAGLYLAMRKLTDWKWATAGTAAYLLTGGVLAYALECAEYNLMLCMLCWTLCCYLHAMIDGKTGWIAGFFVFCCLSIYSQYGAAFVLLPLYCSLMIHFLKRKEKVREVLVFTGVAALVVIPLAVFFLFPQLGGQGTTGVSHAPVFRKGNAIVDFVDSFVTCVGLLCGNRPATAALCLGTVCAIVAPFLQKKGDTRSILIQVLVVGVCAWLIYYAATACSFYGYNDWDGNRGTYNISERYVLFLVPVLVLSGVAGLYWLTKSVRDKWGTNGVLAKAISVFLILLIAGYCGMGVREMYRAGVKDDVREAEKVWMDAKAYDEVTLVHQWTDANFQFYLIHDDRYDESFQEGIVPTEKWIRYASDEELVERLSEMGLFGLDSFYYVCPRTSKPECYRAFLSAAEMTGYHVDVLYEGVSALLYLTKQG